MRWGRRPKLPLETADEFIQRISRTLDEIELEIAQDNMRRAKREREWAQRHPVSELWVRIW